MALRRLAFVIVVVACYRDRDPPVVPHAPPRTEPTRAAVAPRPPHREQSEFEQMMAVFRDFTDQMCACADRTCIEHVNEDMTKWAQANASNRSDVKPTEEEMKQGSEIGKQMVECMQRAMAVP